MAETLKELPKSDTRATAISRSAISGITTGLRLVLTIWRGS
jgi:hypothetical protein